MEWKGHHITCPQLHGRKVWNKNVIVVVTVTTVVVSVTTIIIIPPPLPASEDR